MKQHQHFAIGIPTLNRGVDLLLPSLIKYATEDFVGVDIYVIDNGKQDLAFVTELPINVHIITEDTNLGVAGSWNKLCRMIFENYEYALIVNDDVYLGYGTDLVNYIINTCPHSIIQSRISWSVFLISKDVYEFIGEFDEIFYPAYYEDSDYIYRIKLKGFIHDVDMSLNPRVIRTSMTQEKDPELVNESMRVNRERYIEKWGGSPLLEKFVTPYNK
jgi:GT2 family glycosyltransferase